MKWKFTDIASIILMLIFTGIICYQNSLIKEQYAQLESHRLAIEKLTSNQEQIVEIDKEQTAAILVLSEKVNGKK